MKFVDVDIRSRIYHVNTYPVNMQLNNSPAVWLWGVACEDLSSPVACTTNLMVQSVSCNGVVGRGTVQDVIPDTPLPPQIARLP